MGATTIEWADYTFNPWQGCTKVAAGCQHCYAESIVNRFAGRKVWGPKGARILAAESGWKKPLAWNRKAQREGVRRRVFCASLADVFEDFGGPIVDHQGETQPDLTLGDLRSQLFATIDATPHLDWLLLTKRPENIRRMWSDENRPRKNVWLLTSVATQADAERNVPELLKCRDLAPVLGLSCEPLLGSVTLDTLMRGGPPRWLTGEPDHNDPTIDWVIAGGESGPHARPMHPDWARWLRDQCAAAGVAFFFKQWGEWAPCHGSVPSNPDWKRVGKAAAGRLLDGRTHDEFPKEAPCPK